MRITRLGIRNLRCITSANCFFHKHLNIFIGPNGSGKTTFLEALYLLSHGRSFRSYSPRDYIRFAEEQSIIYGEVSFPSSSIQTIGIKKTRCGGSTFFLNGSNLARKSDLTRLLPVQLFHSDTILLLNGGPGYRRKFLDWGCFHLFLDFLGSWQTFQQALKCRNSALRQTSHYSEIAHWDVALSQIAVQLTELRLAYFLELEGHLLHVCQHFFPQLPLTLGFYAGWPDEVPYHDYLASQFSRDRRYTYTVHGPHKADLRIQLEGMPVENVLSRGQLKLLMYAIKLAQGTNLAQRSMGSTLYLIDEFTAELDQTAQGLLIDYLLNLDAQLFITATDSRLFSDLSEEDHTVFLCNQGNIVEKNKN